MFNEVTKEELMVIEGGNGSDTIVFDKNSGGMPWIDYKTDHKTHIDINVYTPVGTIKIHDNFSNNLNLNKGDNSRGKYI